MATIAHDQRIVQGVVVDVEELCGVVVSQKLREFLVRQLAAALTASRDAHFISFYCNDTNSMAV